ERNYAASLPEVFEVVDEFGQFCRLVYFLSLPILYKLDCGLQDGRGDVEREFANDDIDRSAGLRGTRLNLFADTLNCRQDLGTSLNAIERRGERDHLRFAIVARDGSQNLPQLFGVHMKARQARYSHQADVIAAGDD